MIVVKNARKKEVKEFQKKEWPDQDLEHYGKPINWNEVHFSFKAAEKNKILGIAVGKNEGGVIFLENIIVAKTARGNGIGALLLKKIEKFAKKMEVHKIWLETGKGWGAEEFYKKEGFKEVVTLNNHHLHKDFVIYEKFI